MPARVCNSHAGVVEVVDAVTTAQSPLVPARPLATAVRVARARSRATRRARSSRCPPTPRRCTQRSDARRCRSHIRRAQRGPRMRSTAPSPSARRAGCTCRDRVRQGSSSPKAPPGASSPSGVETANTPRPTNAHLHPSGRRVGTSPSRGTSGWLIRSTGTLARWRYAITPKVSANSAMPATVRCASAIAGIVCDRWKGA